MSPKWWLGTSTPAETTVRSEISSLSASGVAPLRLALRGIAAAGLSAVVMRLIGGQPAGPAVVTGIITWFVLTGRADLAPPPGR